MSKQWVMAKIQDSRAFEGLTEESRRYFSERAIPRELKKGDTLWKRQETAEFCAFVVEGLIEITLPNERGEDKIIGIFGPGDLIGIGALFKRSVYPANAKVATKTCKVIKLYIRSIDFDLTESQRANVLLWQREKLLIHEQILRDKIMILGAGRLDARLVEFFEHLILRFATELKAKNKKVFVPIPLSKTQIAKMIEARVETVIRHLNRWEKLGFIQMNSKGITLIQLEKWKACISNQL